MTSTPICGRTQMDRDWKFGPRSNAAPPYNQMMSGLSTDDCRRVLGRDMARAHARFIALCKGGGHKVAPGSVLEWLKSIYPSEREEALRLLWFRLDEVDRRNSYVDLLAYQAQGLERLVAEQEKLRSSHLPIHERWATQIEMRKTKDVLDRLDPILERVRLGIEDTKEEFVRRWPAIVQQYGDPLAIPAMQVPQPRPLEFQPSNSDPNIAFDRVRKAISELEANEGHTATKPHVSSRASSARLEHYRAVLGGECGEAFADLEQAGVDSPRVADYARRLLPWLVTLAADDRAAGFRLSALLHNKANLRRSADRLLVRDHELARVEEKAKDDHKVSVAEELSSGREGSHQASEILREALREIELTLQREWSEFIARYGEPPALGP